MTATASQAGAPAEDASGGRLFGDKAAGEMLTALGIDAKEVHYRGIHWNKNLQPKSARAVHVPPSPEPRRDRLEAIQQVGYSLYLLPNGGPSDADVTACPVVFAEWDAPDGADRIAYRAELEQRLTGWRAAGLPLWTVKLETWKQGSVHLHWRLAEPMAPDDWRALMVRLVRVLGSDPSCINPSRLMRLAGSSYFGKTGMTVGELLVEGKILGRAELLETHTQAITTAEELKAWISAEEARRPDLLEKPQPAPQPSLAAASPSLPGALVTPDQPRTYEELERIVSSYQTIHRDNDQYHEAITFIFGLCKCMEEIGRSRQDAVDLAARYHPEAIDTFKEGLTADIDKSQGGSFIKLAKSKGVDTRRHDIKRKPPVDIAPEQQLLERPTSSGGLPPALAAPAPWGEPLAGDEAEEQAAQAAATEDLLAAGREPITLADVLPAGLAGPLTERAAAFPCDPMAFLLPLLCAEASVIGTRLKVKVKETWKEPFVLWGVTVMRASSLKSSIAGVISDALAKWQADISKDQKAKTKEWANDRNRIVMEADAAALKEWEKDNLPPEPCRQLFIVDATLEKIGQFLGQGNTPGMVAFHDELSLWFQQLKRGKDAMDQQGNWLSMWTGGLLKVDRIGRESVYVPRTAQSVYGLATVAGLANIRQSKRGSSEHGDADGLWARFLIWQPDDVPFRYNRRDRCVKDLLLDLFRNRIDAKLPAPEEPPEQPSFLALSDEAVAFMEPHWNAWDDEARQTTEERGQWIGKLRGYSVRIAGLLQVLDRASKDLPLLGDISEEMGRRAIRLSYALLNQYDLLCPKVGGDTGDLDPAVAKLLVHGMDWRRAHGAAPVPSEQLRRWTLPTREATTKERRDWLVGVLLPDGSRGTFRPTAKSFEWVPPK